MWQRNWPTYNGMTTAELAIDYNDGKEFENLTFTILP